MADKTYKMLVTLSNGSTIDAGTFVAPQGPKGDTGTIPEALPQEASAVKSGDLPTTEWAPTENYFFNGNKIVTSYNYVLLAQNITIPYPLPTSGWKMIFEAGGVNRTIDGEYKESDSTNEYICVRFSYSSEYVVICQIYYNGDITAKTLNKGVEVKKLWNTNMGVQSYTIFDTSITANSDVLMELTDEGGVKSYSMEAGKITVIRDAVPTSPIPYTYKVKQTNASGQFTVLNHYVPTIPETPTALPQEASALKSGEMTTSGWAATENKELYNGELSFAGYNYAPSNNGKILLPYNYTSKNALQDWSGTIIDGRSIENCTIKTDSGGVNYVSLYWNSGTPSHVSREIQIYNDGTVKAWTYASSSTTYDVRIVATFLSDYAYTISDADVIANSDILMEITDANHIEPAHIESGKIKVISNTIPTQPIPYTYKVKQTNASGQFTLVNHYVPTKTSELTNDSGFITANDIPSAGEWVAVTGTTATLTEAGTYQVWRDIGGQILVYWDGQTESSCTLPFVSFLVNDHLPYFHYYGASITAGGVLSMTHYSMTTDGTNWTQSAIETVSGFKYRKIN